LKENARVAGRKAIFGFCGGTIPSNFKPYYADLDPQGNFKKVFFKDGGRREFFSIE